MNETDLSEKLEQVKRRLNESRRVELPPAFLIGIKYKIIDGLPVLVFPAMHAQNAKQTHLEEDLEDAEEPGDNEEESSDD